MEKIRLRNLEQGTRFSTSGHDSAEKIYIYQAVSTVWKTEAYCYNTVDKHHILVPLKQFVYV